MLCIPGCQNDDKEMSDKWMTALQLTFKRHGNSLLSLDGLGSGGWGRKKDPSAKGRNSWKWVVKMEVRRLKRKESWGENRSLLAVQRDLGLPSYRFWNGGWVFELDQCSSSRARHFVLWISTGHSLPGISAVSREASIKYWLRDRAYNLSGHGVYFLPSIRL